MARNPLGDFLTSFAGAYTGVGSMRPDPLREAAFAQDLRRWDEQAPQREANLAAVQANTEAVQLQNLQRRNQMSAQAFAEAELRADQLGGLGNALEDPVFKQRLMNAVNLRADDGSGFQLVDYTRVNRSNLDRFGIDPQQFESMLSQHNPNHRPGEDDDELLIPLYRHPDGSVGPADITDDGQIETWSAQEAMNAIRGMFVGSDEYAQALGSLYTGQPGASAGGMQGGFRGATGSLTPPQELQPVIETAAAEYGIPANVLAAILHQESGYDPTAMNREGSGAAGIAQYMPETARALGIDPMDPIQSINATAMQLAERLRAGDSMQEAVMHHFAGPDRNLWGERTMTYGQEVMAKAAMIAGEPETPTPSSREVISGDALASANQVAQGVQQPGAEPAGQVEMDVEPFDLDTSRRQIEQERQQLRRQLRRDPENAEAQQRLAELDTLERSQEEFDALWEKYDRNATVRDVAASVPAVEGESGETVFGVPKDALPEGQTRASRRVAEGKGVSPAQAKELALNPETLPQPTPRATVAAGASFLGGLRPSGGNFEIRGGERPSHKQLTTAVILTRAGLLDSDSLTRYADLGVVSASGVSVIQTGMQQVAQNQRQQMSDATTLQRTAMQQAGQTERTMLQQAGQTQRELIKRGDGSPTFGETRDQNILAARNLLEARNVPPDDVERLSTIIGSKATQMAVHMDSMQTNDWQNPRMVEALAKLHEFDRNYNDASWRRRMARSLFGAEVEINLADNPLAVYLMGQGSGIMEIPEHTGFFESVLQGDPWVAGAMDSMRPPRFISTIYEPMVAAAREMQMEGQLTPEIQANIFDVANAEIRSMNDRSALNNDTLIKQVVGEAARAYLELYQGIR